jgi:hypothetical protein
MRVLLIKRTIVTLVASLVWSGVLVLPAKAEAPDVCGMVEESVDHWTDPNCDQGQCEEWVLFGIPICNTCEPRWYLSADAIALERTTARNLPVLMNVSPVTDPLTAKDINFPATPGFRIDGIRRGAGGWDWEVGYFQLDGFSADGSVPGSSLLITDGVGGSIPVIGGEAHYTSAIYSGEISVRKQWNDWFTGLAGFRMGQLNEHFIASGIDAFVPTTAHSVGASTYNHLYGFQIGADMGVYDMGGPLQINVICKAGIYDNYGYQNYQRVEIDSGAVASNTCLTSGRNQASFLGEARAVVTYAVTKRLALRASADAIWITGVALASEQVSGVNAYMKDYINTSGALFYYGGGLGAEYRF